MTDKQENFVRAFSTHGGSVRTTCACGVEFYNFHYSDAGCFAPGELEKLKADPKARGFDHTISTFSFGSKVYVDVCECWHEEAKRVMAWLDANAHEVCDYYKLEKERATHEAESMPTANPP